MKKFLFGLAPLLAVVAFAVVPSGASALVQCRVLTFGAASQGFGATCNPVPGAVAPQNLRESEDGAGTSPVSTNFPTNGLAVNTKGKLRFKAKIGGLPVENTNPQGYAFFGLNLESNPETSNTVCKAATGFVTFADIQKATPSAVFNAGSAWPFTLTSNSANCAEKGKVIIREVSLLFETLGVLSAPVVATGTITGVYENPGANCPAGGIKLAKSQTGFTTEPASTTQEVDNGEATPGNAYICFVSANNYVFPSAEPKWALTEGTGFWKD